MKQTRLSEYVHNTGIRNYVQQITDMKLAAAGGADNDKNYFENSISWVRIHKIH